MNHRLIARLAPKLQSTKIVRCKKYAYKAVHAEAIKVRLSIAKGKLPHWEHILHFMVWPEACAARPPAQLVM